MRKSESVVKILAALVKARGELQNPTKDKTVKAGSYSYKYCDLAKMVEETTAVLKKHGLAVIQLIGRAEDGKLSVETLLAHESGEWLSEVFSFSPSKTDMKDLGSAITYARRYAYAPMIGIVAEDDDDAEADSAASSSKGSASKKSDSKKRPSRLEPVDEPEGEGEEGEGEGEGDEKPEGGKAGVIRKAIFNQIAKMRDELKVVSNGRQAFALITEHLVATRQIQDDEVIEKIGDIPDENLDAVLTYLGKYATEQGKKKTKK